MLFSGIPFLYYFLPLTIVLYFLCPRRARNGVLLFMSLAFYAWGEPRYVVLMAASVLSGYGFALLMERDRARAKLWLVISCAVSIAFLLYFKYADFFVENINAVAGLELTLPQVALPIGISFYTFQILSYTVDVYRGDTKAQRNLIDLAAYVTFFPQLIAGPIVRYVDIARELDTRRETVSEAYEGASRFVVGLSKKILIANTLGELCKMFRETTEPSVLFAWLYAAAFALHIYFDFSGYSDMAIGLGKIFGFHFPENFNYPFISRSISEFWRRWHLSLGSWFRDYVYIPLGGNRVGKGRWLFNILVVWMLTGFWHGAAWNFVLWGLFFALVLLLERIGIAAFLERAPRAVSHVYVMLLVMVSFVLFNAESLAQAAGDISAMFGAAGLPPVSAHALYCLKSYAVIFLAAAVGSTPLPRKVWAAVSARGERVCGVVRIVSLCVLVLLCTAYLVDGSYNPFLYFRF